jgi:hypothetical protein
MIPAFINCSTCFERHTAHHQELKTVIAASAFTYACVYVKPETAITVFELLMMSGVSLETCRAIDKHWNNKFQYIVASCWLFLYDSEDSNLSNTYCEFFNTYIQRFNKTLSDYQMCGETMNELDMAGSLREFSCNQSP